MQDSPGWRWPAFGEQGTRTGAKGWIWTARRWMAVVFAVGLLHAAAYALLVPPWQAPDEPGHMEVACLMSRLGRVPQLADRSARLQAEIIASLGRNDFWPMVRETMPIPLPATFAGDPFLQRSGTQVGDEPPLFYVVPALICRLGLPMEARLLLVRLFGALLFGLTGAVAAWGIGWPGGGARGQSGWRGGAAMAVSEGRRTEERGGPPLRGDRHGADEQRAEGSGVLQVAALVLVLLPMPAFIAGSANNDSLAMLTATAVVAAMLRLQRQGWSWPKALGLLGLLALALASKKTNSFLLPWLLLLALVVVGRRIVSCRNGQGLQHLGLGVLAMVVIPTVAGLLPSTAPVAWRGRYLPPSLPQLSIARGNELQVARVVPWAGHAEGRLFQTLPTARLEGLRGRTARASLLVRSTSDSPVRGRLTVRDGDRYSEAEFVAGPQWQTVSVSHPVQASATYVKFSVVAIRGTAGGEGLLVDDATLGLQAEENLLANPGFEQRARWAEGLLALAWEDGTRFLPGEQGTAAWSPAALERYALYSLLTFAGFWANFGWLQRPLPAGVYAVLAGLCLVAAFGVTCLLRDRPSHPRDAAAGGELRAMLLAWLLALALILVQTLAPMVGRDWQPQGRYLFPALLPIAGLGLAGLAWWVGRRGYLKAWPVGMGLLIGFDVVCLARACCYGG